MPLSILTYNTLFGGYDAGAARRADAQIELVQSIGPDIFLMQEAKGFAEGGGVLLHALEAKLGMRGFLAPALRTGQNVVVFIREPFRALSFEADSQNFHHALASLKVALPDGRALTVSSAHLCPNGAVIRRREAAYIAVRASEDLALVAGDFNSASPHDPPPIDFADLPAHHRTRYLGDDLRTADTTVLAALEAAGWVDVGHALGSQEATVPTKGFTGTEFATMRCDYVMATSALARCAVDYRVLRSPATDMASDHYPVLVRFELTP